MKALLERIKTLSQEELNEVLAAIEQWYTVAYPDWDVVYIAVPKEPEQRKERLAGILQMMQKDLEWNEKAQ